MTIARLILGLAVVLSAALDTGAQVLDARWVRAADEAIEQHRKTDIEVLVLDADGQPAPGATVRVRQHRHAFAFGLRLDPAWFEKGAPDAEAMNRDVFRTLSAVSIEDGVSWAALASADRQERERLARMIRWARKQRLPVRMASAIHANDARWPSDARELRGAALEHAVREQVDLTMAAYGGDVRRLTVYGGIGDRDVLTERIGKAALRRTLQRARATDGDARLCVQFDDALSGPPLQAMLQQITDWRDSFVDFDEFAISASLGPTVVHRPIQEALDWIGATGAKVSLVNVEVGGPSQQAAAINLETLLRVAFANPAVQGIYFNGAYPHRLKDKSAALVDENGDVTRAGRLLDTMLHKVWRSDEKANADYLGLAKFRVFAGWHHVTAVLPDGAEASSYMVFVPRRDARTRIVLQRVAYPDDAQATSRASVDGP